MMVCPVCNGEIVQQEDGTMRCENDTCLYTPVVEEKEPIYHEVPVRVEDQKK